MFRIYLECNWIFPLVGWQACSMQLFAGNNWLEESQEESNINPHSYRTELNEERNVLPDDMLLIG